MVMLPTVLAVLLLQRLVTVAGHQRDVRQDRVHNQGYSHLLQNLDTMILRKTAEKQPSRWRFGKIMLLSHNDYRNKMGKRAKAMALLRWNRKLAKTAQNHASKCIFKHNKNRGKGVGENMYMTSANILKSERPVIAWMKEIKHVKGFSSYRKRCGNKCGHLTQVIWAKTTRVGCGFQKCAKVANMKRRKNGYIIVVCNYSPGGNIQGKYPYEPGVPCSRCKKGCSKSYKFLCNP